MYLSCTFLSPLPSPLNQSFSSTLLRRTHRHSPMNCYPYDQSSALTNACDEMRTVGPVACPKPRRLGGWSDSIADHIRPNTHFRKQLDFSGVCVGAGLLDMIMAEGGYGNGKSGGQVSSSPPFFSGSPPTRSSNPVVRDVRFGGDKAKTPPFVSSLKSSSPSSCKSRGTITKMKIGLNAAVVRIEGFDCLGGDRQNCNISAFA